MLVCEDTEDVLGPMRQKAASFVQEKDLVVSSGPFQPCTSFGL